MDFNGNADSSKRKPSTSLFCLKWKLLPLLVTTLFNCVFEVASWIFRQIAALDLCRLLLPDCCMFLCCNLLMELRIGLWWCLNADIASENSGSYLFQRWCGVFTNRFYGASYDGTTSADEREFLQIPSLLGCLKELYLAYKRKRRKESLWCLY